MSNENDTLIEMPDNLYINPPDPRRKDIADLFDKIINDKNNQKVFDNPTLNSVKSGNSYHFIRNKNTNYYKIYNGKNLYGILNIRDYSLFKIISKIIIYLNTNVKNKSINISCPLSSKVMIKILDWIGINKTDYKNKNIKLFLVEKNKNIGLKLFL